MSLRVNVKLASFGMGNFAVGPLFEHERSRRGSEEMRAHPKIDRQQMCPTRGKASIAQWQSVSLVN